MFPEIYTDRFLLKQIVPADLPFIFRGLSHPEVTPFYGVQYRNLEDTQKQMTFYDEQWREKTGIWWKITERGNGNPVGACGINHYQAQHEKAEIGYWLLPEYWRKRIMTEVLPSMISYVFSHWKLHRLEAIIEDGNETSWRLAEKLGFRFEGRLREAEIKNGRRISLLMYSLLSNERQQEQQR